MGWYLFIYYRCKRSELLPCLLMLSRSSNHGRGEQQNQPGAGKQANAKICWPWHHLGWYSMVAKNYFCDCAPQRMLISVFRSTITGAQCIHLLTEFVKPAVLVHICLLPFIWNQIVLLMLFCTAMVLVTVGARSTVDDTVVKTIWKHLFFFLWIK